MDEQPQQQPVEDTNPDIQETPEKKLSKKTIYSAVSVIVLILIVGIGYAVIKKNSPSLINVASASVTVDSPIDGAEWVVGTKQTIKWSGLNLPDKAYIGIQLANPDLDEEGFWESIATDLPNSGEYTWEVPDILQNGKYRIYIYTQGIGERLDVSDDTLITISGSIASAPIITRISPSSGSLPLKVGTELTNENEVNQITIHGSGFVTDNDISNSNKVYFSSNNAFALFGRNSADGKTLTISLPSVLGAGKISEEVVPGTYDIYVENSSGKSNKISFLVESPTTPSINVIQPIGGEVWKIGSTYSIKWLGTNIPVGGERKINISLRNETPTGSEGSSTFFSAINLFENIENDGQEEWTISSDVIPGEYKIVITCGNPHQNDCPGGGSANEHKTFQIIN